MKRVFVVHGWGGSPEGEWFPWLKGELEARGFEVHVPAMPNTDEPTIGAWVAHLKNILGDIDEHTYFVGHSIGCQTILRLLETTVAGEIAGGAVLVAPWFNLTLDEEESAEVAEPWLSIPINTNYVKDHCKKFIAIFSDNDPVVPLSDTELFKERIGAEIIVEHNRGHYSEDDGTKEVPVALESLLGLTKSFSVK